MKLIYTMLIVCLATFANAQTVVDIIVNSPNHNTLEAAVVAAELADDLSGPGPFTVFAPTDAAFAALPAGTVDALLMDPTGDLAKILLYHVLGGEVLSTSLSDGQTATTLLGQDITVSINSNGVFINDAQVTVTDLDATNGVVHVIDAVLLPPASTVVDVVVNSDVHTTLEAAVIAAELAGTLSGDGPFTLFAPTDAAFAALPAGTVDDLLMDPTGNLASILLHHVLDGEVLSSSLTDGQVATTLYNQDITVTINSNGVFINDAQVTIADIQTFNGVVHVIDAVLLPVLPQTVVEIIVNSPDHNTLEAAVVAAELADDLSGPGPFTVFAPTDAAFAALPAGTIDALLMDPTGDLAKILLYHVLGGEVLSTSLSDGQTATTLLGQDITVSINSNGVFINDAQVTVTDIDATNGVVHVIDAVLLPPASTIVDVVVNSDVHTTLEAAVIAAELAGTLSGDGPFTLFAPTDAAFAALPAGTVDDLLMNPTGDLANILLHHVLDGEVLSSSLTDGQVATTLFNQEITVTINSNGVFINDAEVVIADIQTFNGVVHVIDAVLLPILSSVSDLNEVNVEVMPNPATDYLNITLPEELVNQNVMAQFIGLNGAVLKSWEINDYNSTLNVSSFPAGTYFLLLNTKTDFAKATIIVD
jgi:uncharacterized surface protein with fasciclin (FAS1) repeats